MDFSFDDEQRQLQELVQRFIAKEYSFAQRQQRLRSDRAGHEIWRKLAQLGLLGITLPEAYGGLGGGGVEALIVMEAFGRGLVVEPFLSTVLIAGTLLSDLASDEQNRELLPAIVAGHRRLALAHYEADARYELTHVATSARRDGTSYVLDGHKTVVLHGGDADLLIVSARTSGGSDDRDGISLFLVAGNAPGVQRHDHATPDGQRAAEVTLAGARVDAARARLGGEGRAAPFLEKAIDVAIAALAAEAIGCMTALREQTLEYLRVRRQFGVPIGSFQVLQHRVADMFIACEQARSMAYWAAVKLQAKDACERSRAISAAKTLIGQSARFVGQQAVQLHGGMGVTDELSVSHYFKRLTAINLSFGDAEHHLARYSDSLLPPRSDR
jgi:alkylation response protein AidB-like acyl-CoA dehydrogenase